MRDAFGGVFTMNLLLVFIFIYVAFTAVSLNYAKAFRLKNSVIDFVEQNEIIDMNDIPSTSLKSKLDQIINNASYNKECSTINLGAYRQVGYGDELILKNKSTGKVTGLCYKGVVILKNSESKIEGTSTGIGKEAKQIHYQIITYADWELGALNTLLKMVGQPEEDPLKGTWTVMGDAKVVYKQ